MVPDEEAEGRLFRHALSQVTGCHGQLVEIGQQFRFVLFPDRHGFLFSKNESLMYHINLIGSLSKNGFICNGMSL